MQLKLPGRTRLHTNVAIAITALSAMFASGSGLIWLILEHATELGCSLGEAIIAGFGLQTLIAGGIVYVAQRFSDAADETGHKADTNGVS